MAPEYEPEPIDTSEVELSEDVDSLVEALSANNHDRWAMGRVAEGWTFGPERNDHDKTHPGLVPYEELSESEKEFDRTSVVETLKAMVALGYEIRRVE